jgi:hypothetical protein
MLVLAGIAGAGDRGGPLLLLFFVFIILGLIFALLFGLHPGRVGLLSLATVLAPGTTPAPATR